MSTKLRYLFPVLFLGVFAFAGTAHATSYTYYSNNWGGSGLSHQLTDIDSAGNATFYHFGEFSKIVSVDYTTSPVSIHAGAAIGGEHSPGFDGVGGINANTALAGQPAGNYIMAAPGGDSTGNPGYCFFTWNGTTGDYTGCGTPPPPPASTEYNEVIRYYPGLNYATSTGSTTVGVDFSIPQPSLITGIGFELAGGSNLATSTIVEVNTLLDASTTVSAAGTYSITRNYNFTSGGYYTVNAYFIQNGRKVYNNTIATVLINYVPPNIVVGNDGQFHFNGTTTVATSTYEALHFDCGSTFIVADVCKLAIAFVIPDPSAIQGVKDNFSLILTKAPFSFFTDSKKLLDAFQTGTAATGGTFALTFYGQSAPIVSTTTAASIGLGSSMINTLKDLETIGLWILLAWYLYWRIASIFGV